MANFTIDFLSSVQEWPEDYNDQIVAFDALKEALNNYHNSLIHKGSVTLVLKQTTEPTQGQWETEWTNSTSYSTPIAHGTKLIWYDTDVSAIMGFFTVVEGSTDVVKVNDVSLGSVHAMETAALQDSTAVAVNLQNSTASMPSVNLTTTKNCDLYISLDCEVAYSGSGDYGADFIMNGVKQGNVVYGVSSNESPAETATGGIYHFEMIIQDVESGTYSIQSLMGRSGAASTASLTLSFRQLTVKAISNE